LIKGLVRDSRRLAEQLPCGLARHRRLTPRYRQLVADAASAEMRTFLEAIRQEYQTL